MSLKTLLSRGRRIRVIGFDDAAHNPNSVDRAVNVAGVVCADTRFEGMVWGQLTRDGMDSTDVLIELLCSSKFNEQLRLILLDGITFGGCNVIDLQQLSEQTGLPAIAVMRRHPDLRAFEYVVNNLPEREERWRRVQAAGEIHQSGDFFFQVAGTEPESAARALHRLTDQGKVPEALRLAHLIGSAIVSGQSGKRA